MKFKQILKPITLISIYMLIVTGCTKKEIIDPFWEINLNWDKEVMRNKLYEYSKNGEIINCVFSFEKESYVKNEQVDAKISGILHNPIFNKNELKALKYSLIVEFKNETVQQFNEDFYDYFKNVMNSNYGNYSNEIIENDKISLNWEIEDKKNIKTIVIKNINHYIIDIEN